MTELLTFFSASSLTTVFFLTINHKLKSAILNLLALDDFSLDVMFCFAF